MPAPKAIVTFIDADGDEFPIGTAYTSDETDGEIMERAYRYLKRYIAEGSISPALPFESTEIEMGA